MSEANRSTIPDRGGIGTEQRNPRSMNLDRLSVAECVRLMNDEDATIAGAVGRASAEITALIEAIEPRMKAGGRLIYLGAGTSGRLGVLDASECPPTFQTPPNLVIGLIAGGDSALRKSSEGKEDEFNGAAPDLDALHLTPNDTVLGIAAGGTTPYVLGALDHAARAGALAALLTCAKVATPPSAAHHIVIDTGPELLTGSTRMKAGTATKLVLNTISTTLMVRLGKTYENLMVDLRASNNKLRDRAARIITMLTGLDRAAAFELLDRAQDSVKHAIVMHQCGASYADAEARLQKTDGRLRAALEAN
ncbi:MAG TPA: N-acetylmuramic acid 6-phosphate etherase [Phycisphaerales bacterium]|nr:N-acetylmuramic acid 6-phosphate etherase [Phycisphaerales bacterium]